MSKMPMPFNNPRTYAGHSGIDYGQPLGTPFRASASGKVVTRSYNDRGGYYVWVQYDNGPKIGYHHMDSLRGVPAIGARVIAGSMLGYVGNSGRSTGPHLHSECACHGTTAGYWLHFDKSRVLGQAAPATSSGGTDMNHTSRPVKDIQRLVGTTADGIWGPKTTAAVKAWQTSKRLVADGEWGAISDAVGFAIKVDGDWGVGTTAKFQATVAVPVDGVQGPQTTKAFQNAVGITADGDWGPNTTKALQKQVGVTADGQIGPKTVTALQVFLNAGKKFTKTTTSTPAPAPSPTPATEATPRTPVYPGAIRAWNVPLASARTAGVKVDRFIIHHQGSTNDDEAYFKTKNDRGSCPTWQVKKDGSVVEFIPPSMKPSSTGSWNDRSVAVETQNTSMSPDWGISAASHESIAKLVVWASKQFGFPIDRTHVIGHRETGAATACPGPSMNLDGIVKRAQELAKVTPTPEPEKPTNSDVKAQILAALATLTALVQKL